MQDTIKAVREGCQIWIYAHADYIRSSCLAACGAVGRLFFEHDKYEGFGIAFFYESFRLLFLSQIVNGIIICLWSDSSMVSPIQIGAAIASGLFAPELIASAKEIIPSVVKKIMAKIKT